MNINTQRIVITAVLTLPAKKTLFFSILLAKIAEIHAWKKLKSYKRAPISTQISSAIKSNEQLLIGSQCKRLCKGLCRHQIFYWKKFQRKGC